MKSILGLLIILQQTVVFGQISDTHKKKIAVILEQEFVEHPSISTYPLGPKNESIQVDTSLLWLGDTTGIHLNNEYLLFRDFIQYRTDIELLSFVKSVPVCVSEYREFKDYVRDSMARESLYFALKDDQGAGKFLDVPKGALDDKGNKYQNHSYGDKTIAFQKFGLNWRHKFLYDEPLYVPILAVKYLPQPERFRKKRNFDERKFLYCYQDLLPALSTKSSPIVNYILIHEDISWWAQDATHNDDELGILSQLYTHLEGENPAVGLLGSQAKAFCHWKQVNLQEKFDRYKLPYEVVVTLPTIKQLNSVDPVRNFDIPANDYTNQWRITQAEYQEFTNYVIDSFTRTMLYFELKEDQEALTFVKYTDFFFHDGYLEYLDLDPSDRVLNLEEFPLNFKTKIHKKNPEQLEIMNKIAHRIPSLNFRYSSIQTIAKATPSEMVYQPNDQRYLCRPNIFYDTAQMKLVTTNRYVITPYFKNPGVNYGGIPIIYNHGHYIFTFNTPVILPKEVPLDDAKALIPSLTYEQAMAFYNWKYPIDKFNAESNWQDFVYPSKEQFEAIQRGESIIIPEHEVAFPTPLFRYVVHVFPKK